MSWEGHPHFRWSKMFKGTRYRVFCCDLPITRAAWTKESSYQAANAWWERKRAELAAAALAARPHADRLNELAEFRDAAKAVGAQWDAGVLDAEISRVSVLPPDADTTLDHFTRQVVRDFEKYSGVSLAGVEPAVLRSFLSRDDLHRDRVRRIATTPPQRTIGGLVACWLDGRRAEHGAGDRSANSTSSLRKAITHFERFVGPSNPVEVITEERWEGWYLHCKAREKERDADRKAGWASLTAGSYFRTSRMFVKWLWQRHILPDLPRNLNDPKHTFGRPVKDIPTFTNSEIKLLLDAAHGVHKLLILLMLNTGMTQQDVSDLRRHEIDLTAGRITRYRSKMRKKKAARLVSYKLWPEVIGLLEEHMQKDGERALLTRTGQPWVWREISDQGERKSDNVRSVFTKLKKRAGVAGPNKSVRMFRKTSATRLKANKEYADLRHWFLGHGEQTVADRHYSASTQDQLDAAVDWLRGELGVGRSQD
jgi:integrase